MSDFQNCPICKRWTFMSHHQCPPAYGVRLEDWDKEEEEEVYANSPEDAAITFIEHRFAQFEYPKSATVIVNDWRADHWSGKQYKYEITVEAVPSFSAELIEEIENESTDE